MARILLAEDDGSLRHFLARGLKQAGHEVTAVPDGMDAVTALAETHFELLIADIVMPGMDGVELARRATLESPEIRVMFITGFAAVALKMRGRAPIKDAKVLSKPFHLRELVDHVDRILVA